MTVTTGTLELAHEVLNSALLGRQRTMPALFGKDSDDAATTERYRVAVAELAGEITARARAEQDRDLMDAADRSFG